jgi:hypothetical protein
MAEFEVPSAGLMDTVFPAGVVVTFTLTTEDVDGPKARALVGVNTAVTACVLITPAPSVEKVFAFVATPDTTATLPIDVVPSKNSTEPTASLGVIVAVNVTSVEFDTSVVEACRATEVAAAGSVVTYDVVLVNQMWVAPRVAVGVLERP